MEPATEDELARYWPLDDAAIMGQAKRIVTVTHDLADTAGAAIDR